MIDKNFNLTERFLNIEKNDIFFYEEGDKMIACKYIELQLYWPYITGMGVKDFAIQTADGHIYNKCKSPRCLYAHPEDIVIGEPYIKSLTQFGMNAQELIEMGYKIPNFIDGNHYAIVYVWDGFKPVERKLSVSYDVLNKEIHLGNVYGILEKFYGTKEECAKDNVMKVVMFH